LRTRLDWKDPRLAEGTLIRPITDPSATLISMFVECWVSEQASVGADWKRGWMLLVARCRWDHVMAWWVQKPLA